MKLYIDGRVKVKVGQQTVTFSEKRLKVGTKVSFFSRMGNHFGVKPIAHGEVVSACKDERGAPITPTKTGKRKANAWRWLYRIVVKEIEG